MIIGYERVSKTEQNLHRQTDQLMEAGVERIYSDKISGAKSERPQLNRMLEDLRPGDIVLISDLTRLSRSTKDLIKIAEIIANKKAHLKSLKENWIDTTTAPGKLLFTIFSGLAEYERNIISDRVKEGLEAARLRGRHGGRKPKPANKVSLALKMYDSKEYTLAEISEATKMSKMTIYRYLNKRKSS